MKDKTIRNIYLCSGTALVLCAIWALFMVIHFIQVFNGHNYIEWSSNSLLKIGLIAMYSFSTIVCVFLCIKIVLNTFKGLRNNTAFPQKNVGLLFWLALAFFFYLICRTNEPILYGDALLRFVPEIFLIPFCILFFAFMYKVAADAVEENNLTV